jgi:uncharacterized protein YxeA
MPQSLKKKTLRTPLIIITAVILTIAALIAGAVYYYKSSIDHCNTYALQNEESTGLPESMGYHSLYDPCVKGKGLPLY